MDNPKGQTKELNPEWYGVGVLRDFAAKSESLRNAVAYLEMAHETIKTLCKGIDENPNGVEKSTITLLFAIHIHLRKWHETGFLEENPEKSRLRREIMQMIETRFPGVTHVEEVNWRES